jgi:SAM-dependent methyltransferase
MDTGGGVMKDRGVDFQRFEDVPGFLDGLILDVCCGVKPKELGRETLHLDAKAHPHVEYVADATRMPLEDESFDGVICMNGLEHIRKFWEAIAEFYRVLKPGGGVVVCVPGCQPEHFDPIDMWRFTRSGLRVAMEAFEELGFEDVAYQEADVNWMLGELGAFDKDGQKTEVARVTRGWTYPIKLLFKGRKPIKSEAC